MNLADLINSIPDFARDIRLNVESVLTPEGAPGLTPEQLGGTALACAYATGSAPVVAALEGEFANKLAPETVVAAKSAAAIMAMNNVYYRFIHLAEDPELKKLPARLRMNVIGKPGVAKVDFELMSLAVSALAGCGMCIQSHIHEVKKAGLSDSAVQSAARIAAVIQAARTSISIQP